MSKPQPEWSVLGDDAVELLRGTGTVFWSLNRQGRTVELLQWCTLTGQSVREARGRGFLDALHADDHDRVSAAWQTALSHGMPYNIDYRVRCADGVYRWYNSRAVPIRAPDGSILRWLGASLPIAGLQRLADSDAEQVAETGIGQLDASLIRAARAMLNWSAAELSKRAGVSISTIRRLEQAGNETQFRRTSTDPLMEAFRNAGLAFTESHGAVSGLRWRDGGPREA